jgi:3-oxoacyl-[acyl-carrier-protein] synthase II
MITPLGNTVQTTWDALIQGVSGVTRYTEADLGECATQIYAGVKSFDPSLYFPLKDIKKYDDFILYGVAAAIQAFRDAALEVTPGNADRMGVLLGSGIGGLPFIEKNAEILKQSGPRRISPFFIPGTIINLLPGVVSIALGLKGPSFSIVSACTTGAHNIGEGVRMIQQGRVDVVLAGGAEKASTPLGIAGFAAARALSTRNEQPEQASRPWDQDRDGFVLGDGAGTVVLERYEHAKARGAKIYAEVVGYGASSDAYHMTVPSEDGAGFVSCMRHALEEADIPQSSIGYINAHGTSTPLGDPLESDAIKSVFGAHAKTLAVSSTKSMTGHLLGATGAVEAIFTVLALQAGVLPPTINLDRPSPGCDLNYIPHIAQTKSIEFALSNSFGFGGTNASLIFKRI